MAYFTLIKITDIFYDLVSTGAKIITVVDREENRNFTLTGQQLSQAMIMISQYYQELNPYGLVGMHCKPR